MSLVLTDPAQLTAAWLAAALERRGLLGGADVAAVRERDRRIGLFSVRARYDITYRGASRAPARLFLKLSVPGTPHSLEMLATEGKFYRAYGDDVALPLVRWIDGAFSAALGAAHLLIEDLSETHTTPEPPLPPARAQAEAMAVALARFHARWWEHSALGVEVGERWDEGAVAKSAAFLESGYAKFKAVVGERLSDVRYAVFERALAEWPRLAARLVGPRNLTLIHGDAHPWNCLVPRDPARHPAYLVDLCTCRVRTPANDLAYMMALMWFPDVRRRWEESLLRAYLDALHALGVAAYSWDDLAWDYRFAVIVHLFTPVLQAAGDVVPATTWWYSLERVFAAFDDLGCAELLGGGR